MMEKSGTCGNISTVNILIGAELVCLEMCLGLVKKWGLKMSCYSYKCLLQACLRGGAVGKAFEVYNVMRRKGNKLDSFGYNMLIHALAKEEKHFVRLTRRTRFMMT